MALSVAGETDVFPWWSAAVSHPPRPALNQGMAVMVSYRLEPSRGMSVLCTCPTRGIGGVECRWQVRSQPQPAGYKLGVAPAARSSDRFAWLAPRDQVEGDGAR